MLVKIGETIFDSSDTPIMIVLSAEDKHNISNMAPEASRYCSYPEGTDIAHIEQFMSDSGKT